LSFIQANINAQAGSAASEWHAFQAEQAQGVEMGLQGDSGRTYRPWVSIFFKSSWGLLSNLVRFVNRAFFFFFEIYALL